MVLLIGAGVMAAGVAQTAAAARWSIEPAPQPAHSDDSGLTAVSCMSTSDCVAVGQSVVRSTGNSIPVIERWNGSTWSIQRTRMGTGSHWTGDLSGVTCISSTVCMAVGNFSADGEDGPLAYRWDGSSWSITQTAQGSNTDRFNDVWCGSSTDCIAVGGGSESFAEHWNGEQWLLENIHFGDPDRANGLAGVSCPSRDTCAAVGEDDIGFCNDGYYSDYLVPILGFRKLGVWSLRRRPNIDCASVYGGETGGDGLNAVSCTSTVSCTAVGTAVYSWNGHRWSLQPAPTGGDQLFGVSCVFATACTAVGSSSYFWNGRQWRSRAISRPANRTAELLGVSCISPNACVAVGSDKNRAGENFLLIESIGIGEE